MWPSLGASSPRTPAGAASPGLPPCRWWGSGPASARDTRRAEGTVRHEASVLSACVGGEEPAATAAVGTRAAGPRPFPGKPCPRHALLPPQSLGGGSPRGGKGDSLGWVMALGSGSPSHSRDAASAWGRTAGAAGTGQGQRYCAPAWPAFVR